MQDLLAELLWHNVEIDEAADRLRKSLPGFAEAERDYDALEEQVRAALGFDLYSRYSAQLMRYSNYEVRAYYALGLGLREELVRAFTA